MSSSKIRVYGKAQNNYISPKSKNSDKKREQETDKTTSVIAEIVSWFIWIEKIWDTTNDVINSSTGQTASKIFDETIEKVEDLIKK